MCNIASFIIATKVNSNYLGLLTNSTQRIHVCLVVSGGREPVTLAIRPYPVPY